LILPPKIAPTQIIIIPVTPKPDTAEAVRAACAKLADDLKKESFNGKPITVEIDNRDLGGGVKSWEWIKKGVPIRVEIGPRDLESGSVFVGRRDKGVKEKVSLPAAQFVSGAGNLLEEIQDNLYNRALEFRNAQTQKIDSKDEFYTYFTAQNADKPEIHGGFALTHWDGSAEVEARIKEDLKVTIRCIPFTDAHTEAGTCPFTGNPSTQRVLWAKSY